MSRRKTLPLLAVAALGLALAPAGADLDELQEKAIKAAVQRVAPCVVQIETSGGTEVIRAGPTSLLRRGTGATTGLIVAQDGPDAYIISSAFNFANKPSAVRVAVPGHKERYVAEIVATDQTRMLTLLKVRVEGAAKLPLPEAAPKAGIKIGHTSLAVGRTLSTRVDQPPSVSAGIVSALDRIWGKAIQTDAKVSPANYGGPLVDLYGRVLGVLVPASPRAEGETAGFEWYDSGIGFAIPLEDINRVLPRMKKGTRKEPVVLKQGMLGITMKGQDEYGVTPEVSTVAPGSAAEKAGIKPGDVLKEIDGKPVANHAQLRHRLGTRYAGDTVAVKLQRGKEEVKLAKVTLAGAVAAYAQPFLGVLPIRDDPGPGVEVRFVYPKGPAEAAGLKAGDRVMKVGRSLGAGRPTVMQAVAGRDQLLALLEPAPPGLEVKVEVTRKEGKKTETLTVKLGEMPDAVPAALPERSSAEKALGKAAKKDEKKEEKKDEEKKAPTGLVQRATAASDRTYWVYVPENYDPNIAHAVVIWLHPPGKNREKDVDKLTESWSGYCEDNHIILVGPNTPNERGWTPGESDLIQEAMKSVAENYTIDRRRVVAHGLGQGGEMALYLGFHARPLIRGVATVGAPLTSNPKEKVVNQPLSFFLVVGGKDPLRDAVKETQGKLTEHKYPVIYREIANMGHQYIDGALGWPALDELARWIDSLDRL